MSLSTFSIGYVVLMGLLVVAHWRVGDREPRAWLLAIVARLLLVVWSTLLRVPAIVPVTLAFVLIDWRNYTEWRKEKAIADRITASILSDDLPDGQGHEGA